MLVRLNMKEARETKAFTFMMWKWCSLNLCQRTMRWGSIIANYLSDDVLVTNAAKTSLFTESELDFKWLKSAASCVCYLSPPCLSLQSPDMFWLRTVSLYLLSSPDSSGHLQSLPTLPITSSILLTALFCLRKIYWSNITNNSYLMSPSPPLPPQSVLFSSVSFPTLMSVWGGDTLNTLPLWQKTALRKNTASIMCLSLYDSYINGTVKLFRCKNQPSFSFSDSTA